jgi:hypothetical protein
MGERSLNYEVYGRLMSDEKDSVPVPTEDIDLSKEAR